MTNLEANRPTAEAPEPGFEQRWATWQARGRARDIRSNTRVNVIRGLVVLALGGWLLNTLFG